MNQFVSYLFSRLGKRTCPIIGVSQVFEVNGPWKTYISITFRDGTKLELVEKPKNRY